MQNQAVDIIETEIPLEETMSFNHSKLTYRLSILLSAYEEKYDIMPELEFELSAGRAKPDVAILPKSVLDWEKDIIRFPHPPLTAIEILSPTQSFDSLLLKIRELYLPSGVGSAWLVVPGVQTIYVFTADQPTEIITTGILRDPASGVELDMSRLFR